MLDSGAWVEKPEGYITVSLIPLPKQAAPLLGFAERLFSRPAFIDSLTASEKAMRK